MIITLLFISSTLISVFIHYKDASKLCNTIDEEVKKRHKLEKCVINYLCDSKPTLDDLSRVLNHFEGTNIEGYITTAMIEYQYEKILKDES